MCRVHVYKMLWGVPAVASGVMNPSSIHEDASLILGPTPWVKDPALLWAVVQAGSCSSDWSPSQGTAKCHRCDQKKKKKKKEEEERKLWLVPYKSQPRARMTF